MTAHSSGRGFHRIVCPFCESGELRLLCQSSIRCISCDRALSGAMLETLEQINSLPDASGSHACEECGHPEMRQLPDGVFHCPACGSEVLPLGAPAVGWKPGEHTEAYLCGWIDGCLGQSRCFTENPNLTRWQDPSDRLDYYRGHRAGREVRSVQEEAA